jgi:hypothetical protein
MSEYKVTVGHVYAGAYVSLHDDKGNFQYGCTIDNPECYKEPMPVEDRCIHAMVDYIQGLEAKLTEINNWAVCYAITTPEDMYQHIPHIAQLSEIK